MNARSNRNGETMLQVAASRGHVGMVARLLDERANVNLKTEKPVNGHHASALILAAASGHVEVARRLISAGADVKGMDAFLDELLDEQLLPKSVVTQLRQCCACCTVNCKCCVDGCACHGID